MILLAVPVLMVALTIQTKLVTQTGNNGKKAYEKCGSVSMSKLSTKVFTIRGLYNI